LLYYSMIMKKRFWVFVAALILLAIPAFGSAEEAGTENSNPGLTHTLQANRSLLDQYQNEYLLLKKEAAAHPSDTAQRKLKDLEDKIRTLEEDYEELRSFLPINGQAHEFLLDLMTKKTRAEKLKESENAEDLLKETELKHWMPLSSPASESTYQMHERALKFVSEKKYEQAVRLYEEIVMKNPDDDEAYLIMGHTYLLMGQYQKSERAFHNAVHIDQENIREITPFYENMVLENPNDDMAYSNLGYAFLMLGDPQKAKSAFTESLRINPDNRAARDGIMYLARMAQA